ncbi:MAG: hypothetical protein ACJ790_14395 [Myxococcaceae bacterium]
MENELGLARGESVAERRGELLQICDEFVADVEVHADGAWSDRLEAACARDSGDDGERRRRNLWWRESGRRSVAGLYEARRRSQWERQCGSFFRQAADRPGRQWPRLELGEEVRSLFFSETGSAIEDQGRILPERVLDDQKRAQRDATVLEVFARAGTCGERSRRGDATAGGGLRESQFLAAVLEERRVMLNEVVAAVELGEMPEELHERRSILRDEGGKPLGDCARRQFREQSRGRHAEQIAGGSDIWSWRKLLGVGSY